MVRRKKELEGYCGELHRARSTRWPSMGLHGKMETADEKGHNERKSWKRGKCPEQQLRREF
jgi:hypothetical protein